MNALVSTVFLYNSELWITKKNTCTAIAKTYEMSSKQPVLAKAVKRRSLPENKSATVINTAKEEKTPMVQIPDRASQCSICEESTGSFLNTDTQAPEGRPAQDLDQNHESRPESREPKFHTNCSTSK